MILKEYIDKNIKVLKESSVKTVAMWISPKGDIIASQNTHIAMVISQPQKFGLTMDKIKKTYTSYGEPLSHEGKAREEIVKRLLMHKWIRIRKYANKFWSVNIFSQRFLNMKLITDWANKMITTGIQGYKENDKYFPVIITDLANFREEKPISEYASMNEENILNITTLIEMKEVEMISDDEWNKPLDELIKQYGNKH